MSPTANYLSIFFISAYFLSWLGPEQYSLSVWTTCVASEIKIPGLEILVQGP
jgi:hypothetical protein